MNAREKIKNDYIFSSCTFSQIISMRFFYFRVDSCSRTMAVVVVGFGCVNGWQFQLGISKNNPHWLLY
jgi:hypothetical protein